MPFTFIVANGPEVVNRIGSMVGRITVYGGKEMPAAFSSWQTQDMHRKRAQMKSTKWRRHQKRVLTTVRPHSRYETEKSRVYQKRLLRRLRRIKRRVITEHIRLRFSNRPILREQLYREFIERMSRSFFDTIKW
jgi:hypothetical protein